jgi:ATP-binding cassette subfamily F protein 2
MTRAAATTATTATYTSTPTHPHPYPHPYPHPLQEGKKMKEDVWISYLTLFGFSPKVQNGAIGMLSDGQKSRLIFALMALKNCGVLLLDEPTNHLDIDAVDGLAAAIKGFNGGVVLVSHDFRLIDQVCDTIWVCEEMGVKKFDGNIHDYKKLLSKKMSVHKV